MSDKKKAQEPPSSSVDSDQKGERVVRITAKIDGFRRAGIVHVGTKTYVAGALTDTQLEKLVAEPNLVVEFLSEKQA